MKQIRCEVEVLTPMFLGGAEQGRAELRAPSIKGALRYWWRAQQAETSLEKLRHREGVIFGCAAEDAGGGSRFAIRVLSPSLQIARDGLPRHNIMVTSKGKTFPVNILEYLAYGVLEYKKEEKKNVFTRDYIHSKSKFALIINLFDENASDDLLRTLYVLSQFGGIGARSRNGYGGFTILNSVDVFGDLPWFPLSDDGAPREILGQFVHGAAAISYPSFSSGMKLWRTKKTYSTWDGALADLGKTYRASRERLEAKHVYKKRQFIGAPIIANKRQQSFLDRHAKPYFLRVVRENSEYRGRLLFLPARYAPGLDYDAFEKPIDQADVDGKFAGVCSEFNGFLSNSDTMETVF